MRRSLLYTRSTLEWMIGLFLAAGFLSIATKALHSARMLVMEHTSENLSNLAGDTLTALLVFLLAEGLIKDGHRVWGIAREKGQISSTNLDIETTRL